MFGSYVGFMRVDAEIKKKKYEKALKTILQIRKGKKSLGSKVDLTKKLPSPPPASAESDNTDPMPLFLIPYLTMAVTHSISMEQTILDYQFHLDSIRQDPWYKHRLFDFYLHEAILDAYNGKIEDSILSLKKAFSDDYIRAERELYRPIFRRYQILQICKWLYLEYDDDQYLELALNWARRIQKVTPQHAWAYSFEALYGENRQAKVRAAAYALYLDSKSYWLSLVNEEIKKDAFRWWEENNPFTYAEDEKEQNTGI